MNSACTSTVTTPATAPSSSLACDSRTLPEFGIDSATASRTMGAPLNLGPASIDARSLSTASPGHFLRAESMAATPASRPSKQQTSRNVRWIRVTRIPCSTYTRSASRCPYL